MRWFILAGSVAALAACSTNYCGDVQTAVDTLNAKFHPCTDAGFAPNFSQTNCSNVLNGGNCSDGDRQELQKLGSAGVVCAEENPACNPLTPFNQAGLALQFDACVLDAGIPAGAVSASCWAALGSVSAAP